MKLNIPLTSLDGKLFEDGATVRKIVLAACQNGIPGDENVSVEQRIKAFEIAVRIVTAGEDGDVPLTSEEVTLIKSRVGRSFPSPLILGRVLQVIDPASVVGG